jgi:kynurenine--oxoglutarate transaminase/cysteine-S-conjugate beta-lyase/glutamine--phenylpyruvate transaminase
MKHPGTVTPEPVPEIGSDELHFMFARLRQVAGRLTQRYSSMAQSVDGKAFSFQPAARMAGFDAPTVWHEFTPLANQHKAINLGQGFPDWAPPSFIKDALFRAVDDNLNAYTRSAGHLSLCERLAADYTEKLGHKVNPLTDVVVTVGSTQALFSLMQGMLQEGDEVIAFEPSFDIYVAQAKMAGATLKTVPLRVVDGRWTFDASELAATFSKRSRILIVNSPHNPTGKVFTPAEYEAIAAIVQQHPDCVVVTDEVYEVPFFQFLQVWITNSLFDLIRSYWQHSTWSSVVRSTRT